MAMPQLPVGVDMKLSQPNKLSRPKFNFKMGVYFRGGLFRGGYFRWGLFSVGVCFLSNVKWVFFRGGSFPRPELIIYEKNNNQKSLIKINFMLWQFRTGQVSIFMWKKQNNHLIFNLCLTFVTSEMLIWIFAQCLNQVFNTNSYLNVNYFELRQVFFSFEFGIPAVHR